MRGVVLVPGQRSSVLWLNQNLAMMYAGFSDLQDWPVPSSQTPVSGTSTNLGGRFASPPAGVQVGVGRLEVFGVDTDYALRHKSFDGPPGSGGWSAEWENLGGDLTGTPAVVSTSEDRLDIFAPGPDQGMLHRRRTGTTWSEWEQLGGSFTSTPVVLPSGRDTFDIFARGPDYLIYHGQLTAEGFSGWTALGGGLLSEPVAASAPAAVRLRDEMYVFVVASDWAMWFTRFDGTVWRPWSSMGGSFVSEPVAIARSAEIDPTGGRRQIDVFGVHSGHHAMMHNWLGFGLGGQGVLGELDVAADGEQRGPRVGVGQADGTWHGWVADSDVEADGLPAGQCACAPGISAPIAAATPTEMPRAYFEVVQPNYDGIIHQRVSNDGAWSRHDDGPRFGMPSTYLFNLTYLVAKSVRSQIHDSNHVAAVLLTGARPVESRIYDLPDTMSNGTTTQFFYDLIFGPDTIELGEPATFSWSIANTEDSSVTGPLEALLEKATESAVSNLVGDVGYGIIGAVLGGLASYGLTKLFSGCDGIVDVGATSYPNGRALQRAVLESGGFLRGSAPYVGDDPGWPCGAPHYIAYWAIRLVQYPIDKDSVLGFPPL